MTIMPRLTSEITPEGSDYETVCRVVELLTGDYREQPGLEDLAARLGQSPTHLQRTFTRWAGLTPKAFLQAVTLDHAKRLLGTEGLPLLEASLELGLSGPGRLHDLFVTHEAMSPGEWKLKGGGLTIRYGFHPSPFGTALIMVTERGLAGLAFNDAGQERESFADMAGRWPNARYVEDTEATTPYAARIFEPERWAAEQPLRIVLIGSGFPGTGVAGPARYSDGPGADLFGDRRAHRPAQGIARRGRRHRPQPHLLRRPLPPGHRQERGADRLSLGPDAQARHARLGSGEGLIHPRLG